VFRLIWPISLIRQCVSRINSVVAWFPVEPKFLLTGILFKVSKA
jgi:hypothetical protein